MAASPEFSTAPNNQLQQFLPADTTTAKQLFASSAVKGAWLHALVFTTTNSANRVVKVYLKRGSSRYVMGTFELPLTAGNDKDVPPVNIIDPAYLPYVRIDPNQGLKMQANDIIEAELDAALAATKVMDVIAWASDF